MRLSKVFCLFGFLYFISFSEVFAKDPAIEKGEQILLRARKQTHRTSYDSAYITYGEAARVLNHISPANYVTARLGMVQCLLELKAFGNAYRQLRQDRLYIQKQFKPVSKQMMQFCFIQGEFFFQKREIEQVFEAWHRGRKIAEKLYGPQSMEAANFYGSISKHFLFGGVADSSYYFAEKAIRNLDRLPEPWKHERASSIYNVFGNQFRMMHYGSSDVDNKPISYKGKKYSNRAFLYLAFLDSALLAETYVAGPEQGNSGRIYYNMSGAYYELFRLHVNDVQGKKYAKQVDLYLDKAIKNSRLKNYASLGMLFMKKAEILIDTDWENHNEIEIYYNKALRVMLPGYNGATLYDAPEIRNVQSDNDLPLTLHDIAYYFRGKYLDLGHQKDLDAYYKYALKLIEVSEYATEREPLYEEDEVRPEIMFQGQDYGIAIEASYMMYKASGQTRYVHKAFEVSEKVKSLNLVKSSLAVRLKQYLKGNKKLMGEYIGLLAQQQRYDERDLLCTKYPVLRQLSVIASAKDSVKQTDARLQDFVQMAKTKFPKFYQEKIERNYAASLDKLVGLLPDSKSAAISYFVNTNLDFQKEVYVFCVQKNRTDIKLISLPENYEEQIDSLVKGLTTSNLPQYKTYSTKAFNHFLQPLCNLLGPSVNKLIIMPDGKLWKVPFEALLTQQTAATDYRKLPYLLKKYQVYYEHSATLYLAFKEQAALQMGQYTKPILALAPFADKQLASDISTGKVNLMGGALPNGMYPKLPYTINLLQQLQKKMSGLYLLDKDASEESFKNNAENYSIVHLATHAETDFENPLQSKFILAKGGGEDGMLHMSELLNTNIKPNLAVLSACETGVGHIDSKNEGMTSLSWCFYYLGCPSTISTLWKVDDRQTSNLLSGFYENLFAGKSKNEALQEAKLNFLQKARTSEEANPFYWSGLVLTGDEGEMELDTKDWYEQKSYWAAALALISFAGIWVARKRYSYRA